MRAPDLIHDPIPAEGAKASYWSGAPQPASLVGVDLRHSSVISESWRDYFRGFRPGARLLDIAAGISPVAVIASEVSHQDGRDFEIHGLDQSATLLDTPLDLNGIHFHAFSYNDEIEFQDGYFDGITGQCMPPEAEAMTILAELRRILSVGGRARFTFHAMHGAIYTQCAERIRAVDEFLDDIRLLEHARHMFAVAFTQETALRRDPVHAAMQLMGAQQRYAAAAETVVGWTRGTPNPAASEKVLALIADCWARRHDMPLADILGRFDRLEMRLRATQTRMRAICALAVDETRMHRIGRLFKASGFKDVKVKPLTVPSDKTLIGWDLLAA